MNTSLLTKIIESTTTSAIKRRTESVAKKTITTTPSISTIIDLTSTEASTKSHFQFYDNGKNSTSDDSSYELDIVMDDSIFSSRVMFEKIHNSIKEDEKENLFPLSIIIIVMITMIFISINIAYLIRFKKHKKSVIYELIMYLFTFKFGFCFIESLNILTSSYFEYSDFHLKPTGFLCFVTKFLSLFFELNENFQMLLIWIVLLSQRNLIGFQFLYCDFDLNNQSFNNPIASNNLNMTPASTTASTTTTTTTSNPASNDQQNISRLREKNIKNFLLINSRKIIVNSFIVFSFILSLYFNKNVSSTSLGSYSYCIINNFYNLSLLRFLYTVTLALYFFPIFYWLVILPTFFSPVFGGPRDPILSKLEQSDFNLIRFIKVASVLKSLDELLLHLFTTHYWSISYGIYEISRIFGISIILLTSILFFYYDGVYIQFRRSFFTSRDLSGNSRSIFNNRNRLDDDESNREDLIDYRNLVENA